MDSPIRHLMEANVGHSIFNIAPERKREFDTVLNNFDLIFINQRLWRCNANPAPTKREIFLSRGAVELIWCSSLAHFRYYTRLIKGRKFDKPTVIDPHSDKLVSESLNLLSWAIRCQWRGDDRPGLPYLLKAADLKDIRALSEHLIAPKDRLTQFLCKSLGEDTRGQITAFLQNRNTSIFAGELIIRDLNDVICHKVIWDELGLRHLALKPETISFREQNPEGEDIQYLNRLLLDEIFQNEIVPCIAHNDYILNWPSGLPCPQKNPIKESDENVADELCLVTCAFLLHHELAHIRLNHSANVSAEVSMAQEKEADNEAADWLLRGVETDSPLFVKRMLGIVQANLMTTALGLYYGNLGGGTHPYSFDRLTSLMARFLGKQRHIAKALAFAILHLHCNNSGRKMKQQALDGPEEALDALCDELAGEIRRREEAIK